MKKKLVYICSPCRGDYVENIKAAERYCRGIVLTLEEVVPIAAHVYFTRFLNDTKKKEREIGLECGLSLIDICDEVWVYGDVISEGMAREIEYAKNNGIPVKKADEAYAEQMKTGMVRRNK